MDVPPRASCRRSLWAEMVRRRSAYCFVAPFLLAFAAFFLFPVAAALAFSFTRWNGIGAPQFVGLQNYFRLFRDAAFWNALRNTALFSALNVALSASLGLALALFLNQAGRARGWLRTAFFAPSVVSLAVVALVWKLIYNPEFGLLSPHLAWAAPALEGNPAGPIHWLESRRLAIPCLAVANVWAVVGLQMAVFLAALQSMPAPLYEAARLDGASAVQRFFHITLPLLKPTTFFVVLISLFDSLQVFVLPQIMTRGGLDLASDTVVLYLCRNGFEYFRLGYASAAAYALFVLTVAATLTVRAAMGKAEGGLLPD